LSHFGDKLLFAFKLTLFTIPDTDFRNFIEEVTDLSNKHPEIIARIEEDLDFNARKKKTSSCGQEIY